LEIISNFGNGIDEDGIDQHNRVFLKRRLSVNAVWLIVYVTFY
jgi:hypothetical protein